MNADLYLQKLTAQPQQNLADLLFLRKIYSKSSKTKLDACELTATSSTGSPSALTSLDASKWGNSCVWSSLNPIDLIGRSFPLSCRVQHSSQTLNVLWQAMRSAPISPTPAGAVNDTIQLWPQVSNKEVLGSFNAHLCIREILEKERTERLFISTSFPCGFDPHAMPNNRGPSKGCCRCRKLKVKVISYSSRSRLNLKCMEF